MEKAIDACKSSEAPNFTQIAEKFGVNRHTLARRFKGQQWSRHEATFQHRSLLTWQEELNLVSYINHLCDNGLHPTPQMVHNFAAFIAKKEPGKCWVTRFQQRHKNVLISKHLKTADLSRLKADNSANFQEYFDDVRLSQEYYFDLKIDIISTAPCKDPEV